MLQKLEQWSYRGIAVVFVVTAMFPLGASLLIHLASGRTIDDGWLESFLLNAGIEWLGVGVMFTLFTIVFDGRERQRESQRERDRLIEQMASSDNLVATEAVRRLRKRGWLYDGTLNGVDLFRANLRGAKLWSANLRNADLRSANLQGADLSRADLRGANLWGANLQGAWLERAQLKDAQLRDADLQRANLLGVEDLTDEQQVQIKSLWGSTMPDNTHYDGRYNLPYDVEGARRIIEDRLPLAALEGHTKEGRRLMAEYYDVSLLSFELGQRWAHTNLIKLLGDESDTPEAIEHMLAALKEN